MKVMSMDLYEITVVGRERDSMRSKPRHHTTVCIILRAGTLNSFSRRKLWRLQCKLQNEFAAFET
jgi:hypothetical protein